MLPHRQLTVSLFRDLDPTEETSFRQWARSNYQPLSPIQGIWHPVVQDECRQINSEQTLESSLQGLVDALAPNPQG